MFLPCLVVTGAQGVLPKGGDGRRGRLEPFYLFMNAASGRERVHELGRVRRLEGGHIQALLDGQLLDHFRSKVCRRAVDQVEAFVEAVGGATEVISGGALQRRRSLQGILCSSDSRSYIGREANYE